VRTAATAVKRRWVEMLKQADPAPDPPPPQNASAPQPPASSALKPGSAAAAGNGAWAGLGSTTAAVAAAVRVKAQVPAPESQPPENTSAPRPPATSAPQMQPWPQVARAAPKRPWGRGLHWSPSQLNLSRL
jgi:hypothetical protein